VACTRLDATLLSADIPVPTGESARLDALRRYRILDTAPEPEFDDLTRLAAQICGTPMAAMTLVDADRAWLKSRLGIDADEIPRELTFCAHAIADETVFVVPDAKRDPRFASNPLVTGERDLRFYAGTPLVTAEGHALGTLCALDNAPRTLTPEQADGLQALGRQAVARLELRRKLLELEQTSTYVTLLQDVAVAANEASSFAEALEAALGYICSRIGWAVGHVYLPAENEPGELVATGLWHIDGDRFEPFRQATRATSLGDDAWLPGKAMATRRPAWISVAASDPVTFPRAQAAREVGLATGLATAVVVNGEVAAVLEFFSVAEVEPSEDLLDVLGTVARQLGRICERKRAERELQRLAAIVESSGDAIAGLDLDGTVASWNAAAEALTGYGSQEMLGAHVASVLAHERRRELQEILARLEPGEPVLNLETTLRSKRGDAVDVWLSLSLIVDAAGEPTGVSAIVRDVTARLQAEQRLSETESRYRTLVEQLPLSVYVFALDEGFRAIYRSPQIESLLGYSTDEWLADPDLFVKLLHPEDRDRVMAEVARVDALGAPFAAEFRLIARDGRVVWVHDEHVTIRDEAGNPQCCQGYMLDVTAAKEAEARLRETELRFRALAEQLPLATYIDAPDASGNSYVSPQIEAMTGYPAADWLVRSGLFEQLIHPDDRERVLAAIAESAATATPLSHEYRMIARDGRTIWLRDSAVTVPDSAGRPAYRQGYAVDVTAAKEAEELLREAEAKYRTLIEQLPLVTYAVAPGESAAPDGTLEPERLVYISPQIAQVVGYTAEEWTSDPDMFWKTLHPEDCERVRGEHLDAFRERRSLTLEYRLLHRDGRTVWIQDEMVTRWDDGTPLYAQGYLIDISERKRDERELERLLEREREQNAELRTLDTMKDEFIALVSHELRTPLTSIRGYLELVLDGSIGGLTDEQEHFLSVVVRNAERLQSLVGDLLFIAQIEAGRLQLAREEVDLVRIAEESIETGGPLASAKGIELALVADPVATLEGDRGRLGQLLDNFVSNAIKFTPDGGRVHVRLGQEGDCAVLEVADTGIGIPAGEQERLFERFFRSSTATAQAIQGTGLGLTISKAIAEAHGGRITFTSAENEGTTFRIELPLAPALADAA
jgi:PAS domain S-box-containing protein